MNKEREYCGFYESAEFKHKMHLLKKFYNDNIELYFSNRDAFISDAKKILFGEDLLFEEPFTQKRECDCWNMLWNDFIKWLEDMNSANVVGLTQHIKTCLVGLIGRK